MIPAAVLEHVCHPATGSQFLCDLEPLVAKLDGEPERLSTPCADQY